MESIEKRIEMDKFLNGFKLNTSFITESTEVDYGSYFTEAVFNNGKEKVKPILEAIVKVKDLLEEKIKEQQDTAKAHKSDRKIKIENFNGASFWKSKAIKELEDKVKEVFGFRNVSINPTIERYNHKKDDFEDININAFVYTENRYPIEGIVTDDGFYDKTHSCYFTMVISLGLLRRLTAEEILAVIIHEIGHKIDPAIMDVKYIETNILSKTITDRKGKYTPSEEQYMKKNKKKFADIQLIGGILLLLFMAFNIFKGVWSWIYRTFINKEKWRKDRIDELKKVVQKEDQFRRQIYSEAFADNIARMYGYGAELAKALMKIGKHYSEYTKKYFKREFTRENTIIWMTKYALQDEHKTDVHRINALIREYEDDIKDETIPKKVRENLKADKEELEAVLDKYLNSFDEFSNAINKMILETLKDIDDKTAKKEEVEEKVEDKK